MASSDPTQSIILRTRWANDFTRRWKRVIAEVKRDVNANLESLIDRFVIGNGRWMLPYIRESVAKSEVLGSRDLGEDLKLPSTDRQQLIDDIFSLAMADVQSVKAEVLGQAETKAAEAAVDVPPVQTDIAGLVGIVGATVTRSGDRRPARLQATIDRINKIGITRSISVAAVRVVGGISMGITRIAKTIGAATVGVEAEEFVTAGDDRVCLICENLESDDRFGLGDGVFPVEETAGIIPVHPRCRCRWVLIRVRIPIFNEEMDFDSMEQLFVENGWEKKNAPSIVKLPTFHLNRGEQGERGVQGAQGSQGESGHDGSITIIKEPGVNGRDGERGTRGLVGTRGLQGNQGRDGEQGDRGLQGDDGDDGGQGKDGQDGRGIISISFNRITNELIIKYTDGTEDKIQIPLSTKRPLLGARGTGGGDRVLNLEFTDVVNLLITRITNFPIVVLYDTNNQTVAHTGEYFPDFQAYKIELGTATSGTISIIAGGNPSFDIDSVIDELKLITVFGEDVLTVNGEQVRTVL